MTETRHWPLPSHDGVLVHHVSDTHVGYRDWSYDESNHMLDDIRKNLVPLVDVFVHTGDIVDGDLNPSGHAREDAYAKVWLEQAGRGARRLWAMGNHDIRDRVIHTRQTWEGIYRQKVNSFIDVGGIRFVTFAPDDFSGTSSAWTIPEATWSWLNAVVNGASGPVIIAEHYPPKELGVLDQDALLPQSTFATFIADHPAVVGMLCGHMHKELNDLTAAQFLTIGGRSIPVLTDISSMLSLNGHSRDESAQIQSYSTFVDIEEDRWRLHYRMHGTHCWSGPNGNRVTTLDLLNGTVTRGNS
jgi:hypothetical protein